MTRENSASRIYLQCFDGEASFGWMMNREASRKVHSWAYLANDLNCDTSAPWHSARLRLNMEFDWTKKHKLNILFRAHLRSPVGDVLNINTLHAERQSIFFFKLGSATSSLDFLSSTSDQFASSTNINATSTVMQIAFNVKLFSQLSHNWVFPARRNSLCNNSLEMAK